MMFNSIRSRLVLSHLTVIIVVMGVSGFLMLRFLEDYFIQASQDSLLAQAQITARALIPGGTTDRSVIQNLSPLINSIQQLPSNSLNVQIANLSLPSEDLAGWDADLSFLDDVSLQLGTQLNTHIRILDPFGSVQLDSWQQDVESNLASDPLVIQAMGGEEASSVVADGEIPMMRVVLPFYSSGQMVGFVYLEQPLFDVITVLQDLRSRWLISMSIAMVISVVVGYYLSGAFTRPLSHLTAAAKQVAKGDLGFQVRAKTGDEIGELALAFNQMTAQLKSAKQTQIDFVADVSHELRTPLTSVKGLVETLRDGAVDDPEVRDDFLEIVENETDRLTRLVNDLLLLSQADSDRLNLALEETDIIELISQTTDRMKPLAESKGLRIEISTEDEAISVLIDVDRINQVLLNLLDNAVKFSKPTGSVIIEVRNQDRFAVVSIIDQGIGIPGDDLERIGARFYRAEKARSRAKGGSGLGLAIARTLIELHGGLLWVESEEGRGTQVSFSVPMS
jgi:signal transduction histidine kinase